MANQPPICVYEYLDAKGVPFYVGQGTRKRMLSHGTPSQIKGTVSFYNKQFKRMLRAGEKWSYRCIQSDLTTKEAIEVESRLILQYGRLCLDNGPLTNIVCDLDGPIDIFLCKTRPIGQFDLKTRQLLKTFAFTDGVGWDGYPMKQLHRHGFSADLIKWVLYDDLPQADGFWWDHLPRTPDELERLRRAFAPLEAEDRCRRHGIAAVERIGDRIEISVEGEFGSDSISVPGNFSPKRIRSMMLKSTKKLNREPTDWASIVDDAIDDWLAKE